MLQLGHQNLLTPLARAQRVFSLPLFDYIGGLTRQHIQKM
jgi:hypothetical protein